MTQDDKRKLTQANAELLRLLHESKQPSAPSLPSVEPEHEPQADSPSTNPYRLHKHKQHKRRPGAVMLTPEQFDRTFGTGRSRVTIKHR
jgi:hypothetical protein